MNITFEDKYKLNGFMSVGADIGRMINVVSYNENKFKLECFIIANDDEEQRKQFGDRIVNGENIHEVFSSITLIRSFRFELDLDVLIGKHHWADNSIWCPSGTGGPNTWMNITAETYNAKQDINQYLQRYNINQAVVMGIVKMYVPFADSNFMDCHFHLSNQHPDYACVINGIAYMKSESGDDIGLNKLPSIHIDSIVGYDVNLAIVDEHGDIIKKDCVLYTETISGYTPKTRINIVDGVGTLKTIPLGLSKGDVVDVKIGWKYFTNVVNPKILVEDKNAKWS